MNTNDARQQERVFLDEQLVEVRRKIARLENVRSGCHDCAEANGLDAFLSAATAERRLIEDLIAREENEQPSLTLSAAIMARIRQLGAQRASAAQRWRRGRPTPPAYWETANERTVLEQLLRRWNAWQAGRPYYPSVSNGAVNRGAPAARPITASARANPWETPSALPASVSADANEDPDKLLTLSETRRAELLAALELGGIAPDHAEIVFASDQIVFLTAYAHDERERRVMINTILRAGYVATLLADIRVSAPARCPICRARQAASLRPSANGTAPPGR